jgi:hypothetical protein
MRGLSSISTLAIFAVGLALFAASPLTPTAEFIGWRGQTAVFSDTPSNPSGGPSKTSYFIMTGSRVTPVRVPGVTQAGRPEASAELRILSDPREEEALRGAIDKWNESEKRESPKFPSVRATLIVTVKRDGQDTQIWRNTRTLGAHAAEGGYNYDPPRLRSAQWSPSGLSLLIELVNDSGAEYVLVPAPRAVKPGPVKPKP